MIQCINHSGFHFEKYHTAYSFAASEEGSRCAQILVNHGARKIIPELSRDEKAWLHDYHHAKMMESTAWTGTGLLVVMSAGVVAVAGAAIADSASGDLRAAEARRPPQQLGTKPKD